MPKDFIRSEILPHNEMESKSEMVEEMKQSDGPDGSVDELELKLSYEEI